MRKEQSRTRDRQPPWEKWEQMSERNWEAVRTFQPCPHARWNFDNYAPIGRSTDPISGFPPSSPMLRHRACFCLERDRLRFEDDLLYERKYVPGPVMPKNHKNAIVVSQDGVVQGPYLWHEWESYSIFAWDWAFHLLTHPDTAVCSSMFTEVYLRDVELTPFKAAGYHRHVKWFLLAINFLRTNDYYKHLCLYTVHYGADVYHNQKPTDASEAKPFRKDEVYNETVPHYLHCRILGIDPKSLDLQYCREWDRKWFKAFLARGKKNIRADDKRAKKIIEGFREDWQWFKPFKHVLRRKPKKSNGFQVQPLYTTNPAWERDYGDFSNTTITKWLLSGALVLRPAGLSPTLAVGMIYAAMDWKPRLCYDGSITKWLEGFKSPCKLDLLHEVAPLVPKNAGLTKSDDKDGFHAVKMNEESVDWCTVSYAGRHLSYLVLVFGERLSPGVYQMINEIIVNVLRHFGCMVSLYIDDRLYVELPRPGIRPEELPPRTCLLGTLLVVAMGGTISIKKSTFANEPATDYLGLNINSSSQEISVPEAKWKKFLSLASTLLEKGSCSYKDLEKLRGYLCSFILACSRLKLYIRRQTEALVMADHLQRKIPINQRRIKLDGRLREEIQQWTARNYLSMRKSWLEPKYTYFRAASLFTDASSAAAGAVVFRDNIKLGELTRFFSEDFHEDSIAVKEALAILYTLRQFSKRLQGCHLVNFCDNQVVVAAFSNDGARDPRLNDVVRLIYEEVEKMGATFVCYWVSTKIQLGDRPSRICDFNEEFLPRHYFAQICRLWNVKPEVDAMATAENKKCQKFIPWTLSRDPHAISNDFLNANKELLRGRIFYIFPPKSIANRVIAHLQSHYWDEKFILILHAFEQVPLAAAIFQNHPTTEIKLLDQCQAWTFFPSERKHQIGSGSNRQAFFLTSLASVRNRC